jgi:branched-chain amino acid transport system substrate-binding protein
MKPSLKWLIILLSVHALLTSAGVFAQEGASVSLRGFAATNVPNSANDIVLGQSVPLSGSNADIGRDMRDGALAVFAKANASGTLGGRKIRLVTLDNANNRARALENTKQLLDSDKAVALFGYNSATTSLDALPLVKQNSMAMFAPFTGSSSARNHPNVFTIRASYEEEAAKIVTHQKSLGATRAVVFYYDDEAGKANLESVSGVFDAASKPRTLAIKRNAKLDAATFAAVLKDPPHYVLATTQYSVVGDFLKIAVAASVNIPIAAVSFVNPDELAETYGDVARGTIVSQVVPAPRGSLLISNAALKDCATSLAAFNGAKLNYTSLESCLAAKTLVRVIQKVGAPRVTRAALLHGLEGAGRIDLDGYVLNFSKSNSGSSFVDLTILSRGNQFSR